MDPYASNVPSLARHAPMLINAIPASIMPVFFLEIAISAQLILTITSIHLLTLHHLVILNAITAVDL